MKKEKKTGLQEVEIRGRKIPLRFKMPQVEEMQNEVGNIIDISDLIMTGEKKVSNTVKAIRIMGNAGLQKAGKEPFLTDEWLNENMNPLKLLYYQTAVITTISLEASSEAETEREENEERDLVLEEIQKKKDPTNSHTEGSSAGVSSPG